MLALLDYKNVDLLLVLPNPISPIHFNIHCTQYNCYLAIIIIIVIFVQCSITTNYKFHKMNEKVITPKNDSTNKMKKSEVQSSKKGFLSYLGKEKENNRGKEPAKQLTVTGFALTGRLSGLLL